MTRDRYQGAEMAKLFACYLLAVAVGAVVLGVFTGFLEMIPFAAIVGAVLGLPGLFVTLLIFMTCTESIRNEPGAWCLAAPFVVATIFLLLELAISGEVLGFAALSFVGASFGAYVFRVWALAWEPDATA